MTTDRMIEANRSNARKSTGPRSPAGKARVTENALKHGLVGRHIVLPNENAKEYNTFRAGIFKSLEPEGDLECLLADKIVADAWRLRRIPMLEAAVHRRSRHDRVIQKVQDVVDEARSAESAAIISSITKLPARADYRVDAERILQEVKDEKANLYIRDAVLEASRVLETSVVVFANLWRHERALTHALHRTLHELQRLQAMRRGELVPAPEMIDLHVHTSLSRTAVADSDPAPPAEPCNSVDRDSMQRPSARIPAAPTPPEPL